jgi:hypothetical protein
MGQGESTCSAPPCSAAPVKPPNTSAAPATDVLLLLFSSPLPEGELMSQGTAVCAQIARPTSPRRTHAISLTSSTTTL